MRRSRLPVVAASAAPATVALAAVVLATVLSGCLGGRAPSAALDDAARSYRAGEPAFVLEAIATVRDGETGVDVYLGVPRASLVFRQSGDSLEAVARWAVTLEGDGVPAQAQSPTDTLREGTAEAVRQPGPVWRRVRLAAPPGRYRVTATLEDRASERTAERQTTVDVFAPDARPALGALRLVGLGSSGRAAPLDAASVPAGTDSLRAVVQATAVPDGAQTVLTVVRLRADSQPAAPPTDFTPTPGTLARRGVDPGRADTVQTVRQTVLAPDRVLDVEAPLPALAPGVYAVRLDLEAPDGTPLDTAGRVVVVRRADYPALTRLGDLVEPLTYLADRREIARIAGAPPDQRRAFDRFWGERMDDRRLAAATVRAFYERVEEANRLFATYKDGWKTDPGMIYILFGPPLYVEATADGERWSYGSGGAAPAAVEFERTAGRAGETGLFSVLTLVRDRGYSESWERARRQWRSGVVP